jgi:predicted site-specific integrase-resolvase
MQNINKETTVYNLKNLSKKLEISIRTLRIYIKKGRLKAKKVGRAYYVLDSNLRAFLNPDT